MKFPALEKTFKDLLANYTSDDEIIEELWDEVVLHHSGSKRHYHSLNHLNHLLEQLLLVKGEISHWNSILFALFYHDIVYSATKKNNEELSAAFGKLTMTDLSIDIKEVDITFKAIIATMSHDICDSNDINLFTDADLAILGGSWESYNEYTQKIRKEYSLFPNLVYKKGRKKVLKHFLEMESIFKTDFFRNLYEKKARSNIQKELKAL